MPVTIRVQNFQSIVDETIEVDGFTAVTGGNNIGKTAMVRAVKGLLCNSRGTSFVRSGEDYCTVTLSFDDGTSVSWQKGKDRNRYKVNGEEWLDKVGNGVPEEVEAVLGMHPIKMGSVSLWPNINDATEGTAFLLNQSGSVLAEAVSDVETVGRLNKALKEAESDRRRVRSTLKIRNQDRDSVRDSLSCYDGLDSINTVIADAETARNEARETLAVYEESLRMREEITMARGVVSSLSGVNAVQVGDDTAILEAKKLSSVLSEVESLGFELRSCRASLQSLESRLESASGGVIPDDSVDEEISKVGKALAVLEGFRAELLQSSSEVTSTEAQLAVAEADLESASAEVDSMISSFGFCLACGARHDVKSRASRVEDRPSSCRPVPDLP